MVYLLETQILNDRDLMGNLGHVKIEAFQKILSSDASKTPFKGLVAVLCMLGDRLFHFPVYYYLGFGRYVGYCQGFCLGLWAGWCLFIFKK